MDIEQVSKLIAYIKLHNDRGCHNIRREPNPKYPLRCYILAEFGNIVGPQTGGFYLNPEMLHDEDCWPDLVKRIQGAIDANIRRSRVDSRHELPDEEFGGPDEQTIIH